jgi:hypothetical protein
MADNTQRVSSTCSYIMEAAISCPIGRCCNEAFQVSSLHICGEKGLSSAAERQKKVPKHQISEFLSSWHHSVMVVVAKSYLTIAREHSGNEERMWYFQFPGYAGLYHNFDPP